MHTWRRVAYLLIFTILLLITACEAETTIAPPTRVPTLTALPPTITPTSTPVNTSTPRPTQPAVPRINAENQADQAFVRVIHASPDISAISMDIQGLQIASSLPYPLVTTPTSIEAGEYTLTISTAENPTLIQRSVVLSGRTTQIFMVSGTSDNPQLSIYNEPIAPLNNSQSRVTFIHAIENGPVVNVSASGELLADAITYGEMSSGTILESNPTTFTFSASDQTLLDYPINLRSRQSSVFVLAGTIDAPEIIAFNRQVEGITRVRVIHASPQIPAVDVYLNDARIATTLGFTRSSERQNFSALTTQLDIYPAGAPTSETEPLYSQQINLRSDQAMSLVISGSTENPDVLPITDDLSRIRPDLTRIAFLNPLQEYDNVNVSLQGGTVEGIPELLGYGQLSPSAELDAGSNIFIWSERSVTQDDNDGEILEVVEDVQLEAGRSYLYILTGQNDNTPLIFSESVDVIVEAVDVPSDVELTPTPSAPTRIRFVNAIDEAPTVNIFLDTIGVSTGLGYGSSTDYIIIPAGSQTISVQNSQTNAELASVTFDFQLATNYSMFVYGYELDGYRILITGDNRVIFNNSTSGSIRIVNLSYDREDFQLGVSVSPAVRNTASEAESTAEVEVERVRPVVPLGVDRVSNVAAPETALPQTFLPPAVYDIYIIDPVPNRIARIFFDQPIESQTTYEMIIYQDRFSRDVKGFLLSYSTP